MRAGFYFALTAFCLLVHQQLRAETSNDDSADDAFGRLVGVELIGLYSELRVRGFSLENAGNYRIEGNYFVRASPLPYMIRDGTTVRIGVNALRYDFPAPSGVVEYGLRRAAPGVALNVEAGRRANNGQGADIIGSIGNADSRLGLVAAVSLYPDQRYPNGAGGDYYTGGVVGRWLPDGIRQSHGFRYRIGLGCGSGYRRRSGRRVLPPKVKRGVLRSQSWAKFDQRRQNAGLFGSADLGTDGSLAAEFSHSAQQFNRNDFNLAQVTNADGDYHAQTFVTPRRSAASQSGSLLLEHSWGPDKCALAGRNRAAPRDSEPQ